MFSLTFSFGQAEIRPSGHYIKGDTTIEVKSLESLNSIREFKEVKSQGVIFF